MEKDLRVHHIINTRSKMHNIKRKKDLIRFGENNLTQKNRNYGPNIGLYLNRIIFGLV